MECAKFYINFKRLQILFLVIAILFLTQCSKKEEVLTTPTPKIETTKARQVPKDPELDGLSNKAYIRSETQGGE